MTTMAPAVGFAPGRTPDTVLCARCATLAVAGEPFCAHCGARVAYLSPGRRPAAPSATRSLQLALAVVLANAVIGGGTLSVLSLVVDAARLDQAALSLEVVRVLVVGALAVVTVLTAVRGLRETADGRLGRRAWAILAIGIAGLIGVLSLVSLAATALITLH